MLSFSRLFRGHTSSKEYVNTKEEKSRVQMLSGESVGETGKAGLLLEPQESLPGKWPAASSEGLSGSAGWAGSTWPEGRRRLAPPSVSEPFVSPHLPPPCHFLPEGPPVCHWLAGFGLGHKLGV